ncbi:uncharacterized protein [Euphorbia lathyris]|uniref:uncharacterized protein isoform X1 n=3 Tax=Euphorbia lathyris TaxID=212925 RepID=UPI003313CBF4
MVLRQNLINQIEMAMVVQIILMVDFPYFRNMGDEWVEAHAYVINNCDEVIPFLEEYSQIRESTHPQQSFNDWFKDTVKMQSSQLPTRKKFIQPGKLGNKNRVLSAFQHSSVPHDKSTKDTPKGVTPRKENLKDVGLIVHFGDLQYHDKGFNEECCFLDILSICKKFVDIYSVGLRFADDDGRPVQNDLDVLNMFKNYSGSTVIHLYAKRDINSRGLIYKLPSDNPNLASDIAPIPIVTNVKIMGELKVNQKVMVYGAISNRVETASIAEFFITMNKNLDIENGLTPISSPSKEKELELPLQAVGQFVVAKLTPMTEDGKSGDPKYAISQTFVKSDIPKIVRKVRGCNKNKKICSLKQGEKLDICFCKSLFSITC